jgi:peroxiredoxin family protein
MAADPNKLGIFVTSPQHMRHILGITKAAVRAGKKVMVFFTFKSIHLTKSPEFSELTQLIAVEDVAICADSYICEGFDNVNDIPRGLTDKQMRTQAFHGAILDECAKYIVM